MVKKLRLNSHFPIIVNQFSILWNWMCTRLNDHHIATRNVWSQYSLRKKKKKNIGRCLITKNVLLHVWFIYVKVVELNLDLVSLILCVTFLFFWGNLWFRTFDDGFPNLFIPNAQGIRGQHVAFLASFSSPGVIFEQLSVIYALPKLFISSFTLVLPFFPTGTSERMEDEGDVATAFTLARILSNIPISRGGPTSLVTFDIHALQVSTLYL